MTREILNEVNKRLNKTRAYENLQHMAITSYYQQKKPSKILHKPKNFLNNQHLPKKQSQICMLTYEDNDQKPAKIENDADSNKKLPIMPAAQTEPTIQKTVKQDEGFVEIEIQRKPEQEEVKIELNSDEIAVRDRLQVKLNKNSTSHPADIRPLVRQHEVQFKIEFTDPNQKPIRCKTRPIPFNQAKAVGQVQFELLSNQTNRFVSR
jgi:hypothetical protein